MSTPQILTVDLKGLSQLIEDAGPARLLLELVQNAKDEDGVTKINIKITPVPNRPVHRIEIEDDAPNGFLDLSHAYTLFASSYKKNHVNKSGRYNLGDKLFLAACMQTGEEALIYSTTGTISFDPVQGRKESRAKRPFGSQVIGYLKMTRPGYFECEKALRSLILPNAIELTLNGMVLPKRNPLAVFEAILPTVEADAEGVLRAVRGGRKTTLEVYEPQTDETPSLYELGIPVVETGDKWHVNVQQKIPLNMDRNNVPPSYLRNVRTLVFNQMHARITPEDANQPWVREATSDPRILPSAMETALNHRFGEKRVTFDLNDQEANHTAQSEGFTVIHGRMLNAEEWKNVKEKVPQAAPPAGQVFTTRTAYEGDAGDPTPDFRPESEWSESMHRVVQYSIFLHEKLGLGNLTVRILQATNRLTHFGACYAKGYLDFNYLVLGSRFFDEFTANNHDRVTKLLIHEFGHYFCADHLDKKYYEGLCDLGVRLMNLTLTHPEAIRKALGE